MGVTTRRDVSKVSLVMSFGALALVIRIDSRTIAIGGEKVRVGGIIALSARSRPTSDCIMYALTFQLTISSGDRLWSCSVTTLDVMETLKN